MIYMGSKNKLSKELIPIIQSYITEDTKGYLEPFVGGANVIDKIQHHNKIGCDIHEELIELLKYTQDNYKQLPDTFTETQYDEVKNNKEKYPKWYQGMFGFCGGFGATYFGTFARSFKSDGITPRDMPRERLNNLKRQAPNLQGIKFNCCNFLDLPKDKIKNYVIYCDIPYKNTSKYKTEDFPYDKFYEWVKEMAENNTVLISEYNIPEEGFVQIWSKEHKTLMASNKTTDDLNNKRIEKLYKYNRINGYIYE